MKQPMKQPTGDESSHSSGYIRGLNDARRAYASAWRGGTGQGIATDKFSPEYMRESLHRGRMQTEMFRAPPLPKAVERLTAKAKAWHEWRAGNGGLEVHTTESELFDAIEALEKP